MRCKQYGVLCWPNYVVACILLAGCTSLSPQPPASQTSIPTPTVASLFRDSPTQPPSIPPKSSTQSLAQPTISAPSPTIPTPTHPTDQIASIPLYDDTLNSDWQVEQSDKVKYNLLSTTYVHGGKTAIAITPTDGWGRFFLTVRKDTRKIYSRDRILGVSFWLSGGANSIGTSDLMITVVGSNKYNYWVADDNSVKIDAPVTPEFPLFSETRLYFLHINRSIPPNNWVEVVVWLDDLINDPNYSYVTGMYIKNDQEFIDTFYVDDVHLLVQQ